jgi:hypothetical protein
MGDAHQRDSAVSGAPIYHIAQPVLYDAASDADALYATALAAPPSDTYGFGPNTPDYVEPVLQPPEPNVYDNNATYAHTESEYQEETSFQASGDRAQHTIGHVTPTHQARFALAGCLG